MHLVKEPNISKVITIQSALVENPQTPKISKRKIHNLSTLRNIIKEMKKDLLLDRKSHLEILKEFQTPLTSEASDQAFYEEPIPENISSSSREKIEKIFSKIKISQESYNQIKELLNDFEESNKIILKLQRKNQTLVLENQKISTQNQQLHNKLFNCYEEIEKLEKIDENMKIYIEELEVQIENLPKIEEQNSLLELNEKMKSQFAEEIYYRDELVEELWNEIKKYRKSESVLMKRIERLESGFTSRNTSKKRCSSSKKQFRRKERRQIARKVIIDNLKEIESKSVEDIPLMPKLKQVR